MFRRPKSYSHGKQIELGEFPSDARQRLAALTTGLVLGAGGVFLAMDGQNQPPKPPTPSAGKAAPKPIQKTLPGIKAPGINFDFGNKPTSGAQEAEVGSRFRALDDAVKINFNRAYIGRVTLPAGTKVFDAPKHSQKYNAASRRFSLLKSQLTTRNPVELTDSHDDTWLVVTGPRGGGFAEVGNIDSKKDKPMPQDMVVDNGGARTRLHSVHEFATYARPRSVLLQDGIVYREGIDKVGYNFRGFLFKNAVQLSKAGLVDQAQHATLLPLSEKTATELDENLALSLDDR